MKLLGLNNKPLVAGGKAIIPPAAGGDFQPLVYPVSTPSGEPISSDGTVGGFVTAPSFKNGFIFLNWDVTKNNDLDITGNLVPEIMYVYIPSINVDKGMVTIIDLFGSGDVLTIDNWIKYDPGSRGITWTDASKQTDYTGDRLFWASKSGYSTFIVF